MGINREHHGQGSVLSLPWKSQMQHQGVIQTCMNRSDPKPRSWLKTKRRQIQQLNSTLVRQSPRQFTNHGQEKSKVQRCLTFRISCTVLGTPKARPFWSTNGSASGKSTFYLLPHNLCNNSTNYELLNVPVLQARALKEKNSVMCLKLPSQ